MSNDWFFEKFALISDAPGAVERMRGLVLDLAVRARLSFAQTTDETVPSVTVLRKAVSLISSSFGLRPPNDYVDIIKPPFVVPSHWRWVSLAELGTAQSGSTPSKTDPSAFNGEIPFIKPADILFNEIKYSNESLTKKGAESGSRLVPEGSLLMVCIGTIGKCNLIDRQCAFNQQINSLTPVAALDSRYLLVASRSSYFQESAWSKSSSTTIPILNKSKWLTIAVPLPPLAEQKRIVAKVEELMGICDALEAQQRERESRKSVLVRASLSRFAESPTPENLGYLFHKSYDIPPSELRKSILTLAVQGKLVPQDPNDEPADSSPGIDAFFEIPASWRWKALGVLGRCRTGKTPPTSDTRNFGTGFPFIGPGQITRNGHITGSEKTITNKGLENCTEAKDYDILMVCIGGSIGKAAISREVLGFNQQINSLRLKRDLPEFVYLAITSEYFQSQVLANASGSATPIINKGKWERIPVPIPPLAEQRRIVAKVDQLMALVDELERQQEASREKASKLLDAIVQEMTSGGRDIAAT